MKHTKGNWPDSVRLKMIERSEIYDSPREYQYGYYDGYQLRSEQSNELLEALKKISNGLGKGLKGSSLQEIAMEAIQKATK